MKIRKLKLFTHKLELEKTFYAQTLGFEIIKSNSNYFTLKVGWTELTFEKVDTTVFTNLQLAFDALKNEGTAACTLNAANEESVQAFLEDRIDFVDISRINEKVLSTVTNILKPSFEDYVAVDIESRRVAKELF